MPRRNLVILLLLMLLAAVSCPRVPRNPYARVLDSAMNIVERQALAPVTDRQLFEGAMEGMLSQLDEHSVYFNPSQQKEFNETIDQQFAGVGIEVALDPDTKQLIVLSPVVGSPAYRAGILARDRILKIGKTSVHGMSLQDAISLIRGNEKEPITLTIQHEGSKESVELTLVREIVHRDTVLGDTRNPDGSWNFFLDGHDRIGYLRISSFTDDTASELTKALEWLTARDMRGLVLDLRNDPGGYLAAAVDVCDLLIRSGVIVTTRRRGGEISETYAASGAARFTDFPLAVIVNGDTASAAEIVAACLQDHHRAVVVGQRSYGKGTVQEVVELPWDCGAMKFTRSSYWRPSGRDIQRPPEANAKQAWGVSPDPGYKVPLTAEEFSRWQEWRLRRDVFQPPRRGAGQAAGHMTERAASQAATPAGKGDDGSIAPKAVKAKPYVDVQRRRAVEHVEKQAAANERGQSGRAAAM